MNPYRTIWLCLILTTTVLAAQPAVEAKAPAGTSASSEQLMADWPFDERDIAAGPSEDSDSSGIPDEREFEPCQANEVVRLLPQEGAAGDEFGFSVAINDDVAIVGARYSDENGPDSGSAYIFRYDGLNWVEEAELLPSDGAAGDSFGVSVAISGDVAIVGAWFDDDNGTDSGSAYVFWYDGSGWAQEDKLLPYDGAPDERFGRGVAIRGDVAIVGASRDTEDGIRAGAVYVFGYDGSGWAQEQKLLPNDGGSWAYFGTSVAIGGDAVVAGAHGHYVQGVRRGAAYVFRYDGSNWFQEAQLVAGDGAALDSFGLSVTISGDTTMVGAQQDDDNGNNSGSAYVFGYDGSGWVQEDKLLPNDGAEEDRFGWSVAISGDTAVIGARLDDDSGTDSGSAYVFQSDGSNWTQIAKLLASDGAAFDEFGFAVAASSDTAVIGARLDDDSGADSGSAYVFGGLSDCNTNGTLDTCDIAGGTSEDANTNGIPDECEGVVIQADIKPGSCPNPLNRGSHGVLPVALVGTEDFDVMEIDVSSVRLRRADGVGGEVAPHEGPPGPHSVFEDVGTPFEGETCDCHEAGADGYVDLSMKFKTDDVVGDLLLDELDAGALVELVVTGELLDGTGFAASDCVRLVPPGTPPGLLSVESSLEGAWIEVDPLDETLDGGGFADFERSFPLTTVVTLTAEEWAEGRPLRGWQIGGLLHHMGETSVEFAIDQDMTVRAVYGPTPSSASPKPPGEMTPDEMAPDEMVPESMQGQSAEAATIDRR